MARRPQPVSVPQRANRILNGVLLVMLLIALKVWHLSVVQHDEKIEEARRPQRRVRVERAQRGTIRDRFNVPLAVNRVQYNAAISYVQIRELNRRGRRAHIRGLAEMLGAELSMDPDRIEDLIHSKAALFPNTPYVIKAGIDEGTYYRLRMQERNWLGLHAEIVPQRHYPRGRVGSDVLGYMGAISREEYDRVAGELQRLRRAVEGGDEEARFELRELQERAYSIHDQVGKSGIEGRFDEALRGFAGEKVYQQDIYGNYVRQLPGRREPVAGQRVLLTLSAELQEFAEQLLAANEEIREGRSRYFDFDRRVYVQLKQPWIKGGAIVVMEPKTGDVLALATYPRFDPNTFVERGPVSRWFETTGYVGAIWDGQAPLAREQFNYFTGCFAEEEVELSWERYLEFILPKGNGARERLPSTVRGALEFDPVGESYDELLALDLCRLVVDERRFDPELMAAVGNQSLAAYRAASQAALGLQGALKQMARELFHAEEFLPWREEHGKAYLRQKRADERRRKTYQRPYLDYFDAKERELFSVFWEERRWELMALLLKGDRQSSSDPFCEHFGLLAEELDAGAHRYTTWHEDYSQLKRSVASLTPAQTLRYLQSMRGFDELDRPLTGRYRYLRGNDEQALACAFYPRYGFGYSRSWAFRQASPQGSVFKLVTSYAALLQHYDRRKAEGLSTAYLNPLTIVDDVHRASGKDSKWNVGFFADGRPIPQRYKGGNLMRTYARHVGKIDICGALETSSNSYFGLLAVDHLDDPEDLTAAAEALSFSARTGIDLPGEYRGSLPRDISFNRTGLYAFVNGQHSLVVTPLQTAVMVSSIANGGTIFEPRIVGLTAGKEPVRGGSTLFDARHYPFHASLNLIGLDLPLFTAAGCAPQWGNVEKRAPVVRRRVRMPESVRKILLEGMRLTISGERGKARPSLIRGYGGMPWMTADYRALAPHMVGKTGTAEIVEVVDLDPVDGINTYNHVWFAAISYKEPPAHFAFPEPELVVIVHLRFAGYGKDGAPLAAQVIKKWREIQATHRDLLGCNCSVP